MNDLPLVQMGRARGHGKSAGSDGFELAISKPDHFQQQPTVAKPRDLGFSERARFIMYRRLDDLQILLLRAIDQNEVAKRIVIAEIDTLSRKHFIVLSQHHL